MWLDGKLPFMNMSHTALQPKWTHSRTLNRLRVCNGNRTIETEADTVFGCPAWRSALGKLIKLHSWHSLYYHIFIYIMVKSHYRMAMERELESWAPKRWVDNLPPCHVAHSSLKTFNMFFIYSIYHILFKFTCRIHTNLRNTYEKTRKKSEEQLQTCD